MKIKLDENVDLRVVARLHLAGHDVATVPGQGLSSAPDKSPKNSAVELKSTSKHTHIRLSQLLDAGITQVGMDVRVRLEAEVSKKTGHRYVTKKLKISTKGTVIYNGQEFNKPSPLAQSINESSVNGWEYVEVKKNGQWVCLDELRQIWRKAS